MLCITLMSPEILERLSGLNCHVEIIVPSCSRKCRCFCPTFFSKHMLLLFHRTLPAQHTHPNILCYPCWLLINDYTLGWKSSSLSYPMAQSCPVGQFGGSGLRFSLSWLNSLSLACFPYSKLVSLRATAGTKPLFMNLISVSASGDLWIHILPPQSFEKMDKDNVSQAPSTMSGMEEAPQEC